MRMRPAEVARAELPVYVLLVLLVVCVFWKTAGFELTNFDDNLYVTDNPYVKAGLDSSSLQWSLTDTYAATWQPIVWLSYMLDQELGRGDPSTFHITNLVIHIFNSLLLLLLLTSLTFGRRQSAFITALFAIHPLHVEPVVWVASRKDVLSTFFLFLTIVAYLRYVKRSGIRTYLPVITTHALGLMAKPMLMTTPVLLLLLDYWPLQRTEKHKSTWRSLIIEKIPLVLLSAASLVITFYTQQKWGAVGTPEQFPYGIRTANAVVSYVSYLIKTAYPHNLAVFYPHPQDTLPVWSVIICGVTLIGLTVFAVRVRHRQPYLMVGWMWYLITLLPVIGLVQIGLHAMADRFTYVPLIGIFIIAVIGVGNLVRNRAPSHKATALMVGLGVLIALAVLSHMQVSYWKDSVTLFSHAIAVTKNNHLAHTNLGLALKEQGKIPEAEREYRRALQIKPTDENAHTNLAVILADRGDREQAIEHLKQALASNPKLARAHYNLANSLLAQGEVAEAIRHYEDAVRLSPDLVEAHYNLGKVLMPSDQHRAADQFKEVLRVDPNHIDALINLGILLEYSGSIDEAIKQYHRAVYINPDSADARASLARGLVSANRTAEAVEHYWDAVNLQPDNPVYANDLAWILAVSKDSNIRDGHQAVRLAELACRKTKMMNIAFLDTLAAAYAECGCFNYAQSTAKKAVDLAISRQQRELMQELKGRLYLYQQNKPYREP